MDQFVVDVGDNPVEVGDRAVLFGDPVTGAPTVDDWATAAGTINYEIVTRIGARVHRRYAP
jgi:alanine racemase